MRGSERKALEAVLHFFWCDSSLGLWVVLAILSKSLRVFSACGARGEFDKHRLRLVGPPSHRRYGYSGTGVNSLSPTAATILSTLSSMSI